MSLVRTNQTNIWFFLDTLYLVKPTEGQDFVLFPGGAARHEKVSPKTWRILGFADATWYLRLQVFTTDQPRCYSFDKVLYPPGFCKKIYGFLVFGTKSSRKIFSFSLVDVGTCKNNEKMFLLTGKN